MYKCVEFEFLEGRLLALEIIVSDFDLRNRLCFPCKPNL